MGFIRTFRTIMGRAIKSKTFLLAFLMVFIFRLLDIGAEIVRCIEKVDGHFSFRFYDGVVVFELYGITMMGLIMLVIPVMVYSSAFCDDLSSNYLTYILMKSGKTAYSMATVLSCAIGSFLCVFLGELSVTLLLNQFRPFYEGGSKGFEHALIFASARIILYGLEGAFYGVTTMLLSIFTKSKFVIYTSPLLLLFFFMYFGSNILNISTRINPAHVFKFFIFGEGEPVKSVIYAFIYLIVVIFIAIRGMEKKIERCY